jgi:hypothetical protein
MLFNKYTTSCNKIIPGYSVSCNNYQLLEVLKFASRSKIQDGFLATLTRLRFEIKSPRTLRKGLIGFRIYRTTWKFIVLPPTLL